MFARFSASTLLQARMEHTSDTVTKTEIIIMPRYIFMNIVESGSYS